MPICYIYESPRTAVDTMPEFAAHLTTIAGTPWRRIALELILASLADSNVCECPIGVTEKDISECLALPFLGAIVVRCALLGISRIRTIFLVAILRAIATWLGIELLSRRVRVPFIQIATQTTLLQLWCSRRRCYRRPRFASCWLSPHHLPIQPSNSFCQPLSHYATLRLPTPISIKPSSIVDRDDVIARARAAGVENMIAIGISADTSAASIEVAAQYDGVYAAVGMQPNYLAEAKPGDWDRIVAMLDQPKVVAIGETGLDRHWDFTPFDMQQDYFDRHLRLSQERDLPFIVHIRDCDEDILVMLREAHARGPLHGVMHSFTGSAAMAESASRWASTSASPAW